MLVFTLLWQPSGLQATEPASNPAEATTTEDATTEDATGEDRAAEDTTYLRVRKTETGAARALETAIRRYEGTTSDGETITVDLVAAIHVADAAYYRELNKRFRSYDAVLYEMVRPRDAEMPKPGEGSGSPVSSLQMGTSRLLELQFQLDGIDYLSPNFVHADLTTEGFSRSMSERGESFLQMFFRTLGAAMATQTADRSTDMKLLAALLSPDRPRELKRIMALEFERMLANPLPLEGPNGSTIITVRNQRAIEVLQEQITAGKKSFAIFYGAAHMEDMERQLEEVLSVEPATTTWITAWDIR